ncbi:MAG TPA: hypothetical protein VFM18_18850 [Methanosarcina sp.]|nr:hypothetical protein [Methanosarcina sp.]
MAMTKKEREAKAAAEREAKMQAAFAEVSAGWAVRFANVMAQYANLPGFYVQAAPNMPAGTFEFSPPESLMGWNHHYEVPVVLVYEEFYDGLRAMEEAEYAVTRHYEEEAEAKRKADVVRGALAKLDKEEQELLKAYWSR